MKNNRTVVINDIKHCPFCQDTKKSIWKSKMDNNFNSYELIYDCQGCVTPYSKKNKEVKSVANF